MMIHYLKKNTIHSLALPIYNYKHIKPKIRIHCDAVYASFRRLNVPDDRADCESFTIMSIDSLLVYQKNLLN